MTMQRTKKQQGMTLIELMVVVAMTAILASVAVPAFMTFLYKNSVRGAVKEMQTALGDARYIASDKATPTVICPSANSTAAIPACDAAGNWSMGWISFIDQGDDGNYTTAENDELLAASGPLPSGVSMFFTGGAGDAVRFSTQGAAVTAGGASLAGDFIVCHTSEGDTAAPVLARAIILMGSGANMLSRDSDGNRIHEGTAANISCAGAPAAAP